MANRQYCRLRAERVKEMATLLEEYGFDYTIDDTNVVLSSEPKITKQAVPAAPSPLPPLPWYPVEPGSMELNFTLRFDDISLQGLSSQTPTLSQGTSETPADV